jgi:dipeptidyl-peptidase-4
VNTLWVLDTATGAERELLDPRNLSTDLSALTPEELRRRERAREGASGVVSYATDAAVESVVTVLGGQVVHINVLTGEVSTPQIEPGVFDVRLSPDGTTISYVRGASLCVATLNGVETVLASESTPEVTWGSAEFIAAEEMGRMRGYWWSPDSKFIAACRADSSNIPVWYISDPANPTHKPIANRYPAAGAENATVSLHIISVASRVRTDISLGGTWEYLNSVSWSTAGLIAQTQTRDQKRIDIHRVDTSTGTSVIEFTDTDDSWVELVPGVPTLANATSLVTCADRDGMRCVMVNDTPITPTELQVRSVVSAGEVIIFMANHIDTPWILDAYSVTHDGEVTQLTNAYGIVTFAGSTMCNVVRTSTLELSRAQFTLTANGKSFDIPNYAETPLVTPNVRIVSIGPRGIPVAIVMPNDGLTTKLPVLFDPYGGPHAQRVVASRAAYNSSQWFADQGFIVVIADGVGTPGKGSAYERDVMNDLAQVVLDDQVEVARALPDLEPRADITRVGIRGWSFGGYLAALAVLRRSDIFHAAVAGAPVTDWALYDTHYTERYLGHPHTNAAAYNATNLMNDVKTLDAPLLIIHGLADDNVVAAHTLHLSSALLAAGKVHEVLPLSGVTHMTPQEEVAENLLLHQLDFLKRSLR